MQPKYLGIQKFRFCKISNSLHSGVPSIFEREGAYKHNQICLVEKFFQLVAKKKSLQFESVSNFSY